MIPLATRSRVLVGLAIVLAVVYFALPAGLDVASIRLVAPLIGVGAVLVGVATFQPRPDCSSRRSTAWA